MERKLLDQILFFFIFYFIFFSCVSKFGADFLNQEFLPGFNLKAANDVTPPAR
jgi:hypothetical protein